MNREKGRTVNSLKKFVRATFNLYVICSAYSGFVALWYLLWLIVGDANWWLVLLNRYIAYPLILPLLLLTGILIIRRRKLLPLLIIPALIVALLYHPYVFPKSAKAVDETSTLRVMTYNVLYSNFDYDAVANVILTHQPDLVALQEVLPETMEQLRVRLEEEYPHSFFGADEDFGTTAIFSRYPFTSSVVLDLQASRPAVVITANIDNREVTFISAHLLAYGLRWVKLKDIPTAVMERTFLQNRQAEIVLDHVDVENGIVLVGCDCNTYETASTYRILDETLINAAREVGLRLLFENLPGVKQDISLTHIDYVWYSGAIKPVRVYKVEDSGGSDHLPVLALFEMDVEK